MDAPMCATRLGIGVLSIVLLVGGCAGPPVSISTRGSSGPVVWEVNGDAGGRWNRHHVDVYRRAEKH